jgi:MFS family permease
VRTNEEGEEVEITETNESSNVSPRAWAVVGMLFLFMLINFADKAVIGLSAVPIMRDLHLSNEQFGKVGSAFFFLFSVSAVLVGFLANRVPTRILLGAMGLIWALTQFPMLGTVSLGTLLACRIALGAGEGPAYPVAVHALYKWFPNERRTFPTSLVAIGGTFGVGFIAPLLTWMIVTYDWHVAFGFLGIVGIIWAALWMVIGKEGPIDVQNTETGRQDAARVPYAKLLTARTSLGVTIGGFAAYWAIALAIVWLPAFLIKACRYTPSQTGWIVVAPSVLQLVVIPGAGFLSQKLLGQGIPSRISRGLFASVCIVIAGASMILLSRSYTPWLQIPLAMLAFGIGAVIYSLGPPLLSEITPVQQRGAILGLSNAVFSLAGLIAPWLTGHIVDIGPDPAEGFRQGFLFGGCLICAGGFVAAVLIKPASDLARFREQGARRDDLATEASADRDKFSTPQISSGAL